MNTNSNTNRLEEQHEFTEGRAIDKQRFAGRMYADAERSSAVCLHAPNNETTRPTKHRIFPPACD